MMEGVVVDLGIHSLGLLIVATEKSLLLFLLVLLKLFRRHRRELAREAGKWLILCRRVCRTTLIEEIHETVVGKLRHFFIAKKMNICIRRV
nr:hypothetical protein [Tanacetum cinerariifolium]